MKIDLIQDPQKAYKANTIVDFTFTFKSHDKSTAATTAATVHSSSSHLLLFFSAYKHMKETVALVPNKTHLSHS